ncbi:hypothetical protein OPV22_010277 [Ensete ventricosum]|uniref:AMMECR1 domain-containing protein n=1 Tax=Ensete ventricosum TaxID=4639 RepID=A0AAV8RD21_ENSVE|nr:hypothetical protein OPV22_010277 [Ensete ventricosum]
MVSANREMAVYCFDTLVAHYNSEQAPPPGFEEGQHPLFVTWKKAVNGAEPRLRGCIGTLEARCIINGFRDYALTSHSDLCCLAILQLVFHFRAGKHLLLCHGGFMRFRDNITIGTVVSEYCALRDRRFPPIQAKELPFLECTVSILTDYEPALDYLDWEVGIHGLIIEFTDPDYNTRRSATYLPEVAAHEGWTKAETIDSLMRKAGYNGAISESLRNRLHITRYQSTLYTMHYRDYASYVEMTRGVSPIMNGAKPVH